MSDKHLSKIFDIEPEIERKKIERVEPKPVVIPEADTHIEQDYLLARETLQRLIDRGTTMLDDAIYTAKELETPRGYEVVGTLIRAVSETTKDLLELQKKVREVNGEVKTTTDIKVDKAVFVGGAADLLKKLKADKNGSV